MDWPKDLAGLTKADFLVAFILAGDSAEVLPEHVCGVQVSKGRAVEGDRPYLEGCMPGRLPEAWFAPGFNALLADVQAADHSAAVRTAWPMVRPAASFLATYVRPPRPGFDLQQQRLVEPTGWVLVWHVSGWRLVSYHTWTLMTLTLPDQYGVVEAQYNQDLFGRLATASNEFWAANGSAEDRVRIERATTWFGRSLKATDYGTMLLHGWMSIVPMILTAQQKTPLMLRRLLALAERHGYSVDDAFLKEIRSARNEIAHEASMANADPLAVDSGQIAPYLHPLRLMFLMTLLFTLESHPEASPLLTKWTTVGTYSPSLVISDESVPLWMSVPEVIGRCD